MHIDCVTLSSRRILGYDNAKELLSMKGDALFVVDLDALEKGLMNLKIYHEISKFFEITVMNFPRRADDLIDTMISGASQIVIGDRLSESRIMEFLAISENLLMYYGDLQVARFFSEQGGRMFLSNKEVAVKNDLVYYYGLSPTSDKYIQIKNFPTDLF